MDITTSIDLNDAMPLLRQALDERLRIVVVPAMCRNSARSMKAMISAMDKSGLHLELESLGGLDRDAWLKQTATCYFQVLDKARARETFYNWTSRVIALNKKEGGWACAMAWPDKLRLGQRRSSIRVVPPPERVLGVSLWREDSFSYHCTREQRRKLHPPLVTACLGKSRQVAVEDICPGGVKLRLFGGAEREGPSGWLKAPGRYLWLALRDPQTETRTALWLRARVCHARVEPGASDLITGLEFTACATRNENGKQIWRPVEERIVKELATWTHHCYQEQCFRGVR